MVRFVVNKHRSGFATTPASTAHLASAAIFALAFARAAVSSFQTAGLVLVSSGRDTRKNPVDVRETPVNPVLVRDGAVGGGSSTALIP